MYDELGKRLRSLAGMIPQKHTLPSGADTVICSLEAFMQIKELARDAADALEELSKPRWIPVTERLPEPDVPVIVALPDRVYEAVRVYSDREDGEWTFYIEALHDHRRATAWMPLPEPPKEEA